MMWIGCRSEFPGEFVVSLGTSTIVMPHSATGKSHGGFTMVGSSNH